MAEKLGLTLSDQIEKIIESLLDAMHECGTHYTNFFTLLT